MERNLNSKHLQFMKSSLCQPNFIPEMKNSSFNTSQFCQSKHSYDKNVQPQIQYQRQDKQKNTMYCSNLQFSKPLVFNKKNGQKELWRDQQKVQIPLANNCLNKLQFYQKMPRQPTLNWHNVRQNQNSQQISNINQANKLTFSFQKKREMNQIKKQLQQINGRMKQLEINQNSQQTTKFNQNNIKLSGKRDQLTINRYHNKGQVYQSVIVQSNFQNISSYPQKLTSMSRKNTYRKQEQPQNINLQNVKFPQNQYFKKVQQNDQTSKDFLEIQPKERRQSKARTQLLIGLQGVNLQLRKIQTTHEQVQKFCHHPLQVKCQNDVKIETKEVLNNFQTENENKNMNVNNLCQPKSFFKKKKIQNLQIIEAKTTSQTQIPMISILEERKLRKEDFNIGKIMGKGQFGQVQLVRHKVTGFICGLKTMSKKQIREEKYQQQIARELSIQFYLMHRNVTPLYGYFEDNDNVYLLVQFCPDGHLLSILRKVRRMEEEETSQVIKQICEGIDYIHKQKIIHRDIKPENILFSHGVAKITDFGWAVYRGYGMRKTASGSPLYYSPQIVMGAQYDQKVDIWDIGMMTYQCLLGKVPFKVYTEMDLKRIVSDEVTFPDYVDVTDQAKDFILKILQKKPQDRMTIKEMLRHPFITKYNDKKIGIEVMTDIHKVIN